MGKKRKTSKTRPKAIVAKRQEASSGDDYPSLKQHLVSRRRFLGFAGAGLAAGLMAACSREVGITGGDGGVGDGGTDGGREPDADVEIGGVSREPDYFTLRIPSSGETTAYLQEGGVCRFYVNVATYSALSHDLLRDNPARAQDTTRDTIAALTFEELDTNRGVSDAEEDLKAALLELLASWAEGESVSLEAVTLYISSLDPDVPMDGFAPAPSYP